MHRTILREETAAVRKSLELVLIVRSKSAGLRVENST